MKKMTRKTSLGGMERAEPQRENGRPRPGVGSVPVLHPSRGTAPYRGQKSKTAAEMLRLWAQLDSQTHTGNFRC